jgi:hypothetical protein
MRQAEDLIVEPMDDGVLIYDLTADQIHSLGGPLAQMWALIDGHRSVGAITDELGTDPATVETYAAELASRGLIVADASDAGLTRRAFAARAGLAAAGVVGVGLITSIVAPTPAAAASGGGGDDGGDPEPQCCRLACGEFQEGSIAPDIALFFDLDDSNLPAGYSCSSSADALCGQMDLSNIHDVDNYLTCSLPQQNIVVPCGQSIPMSC